RCSRHLLCSPEMEYLASARSKMAAPFSRTTAPREPERNSWIVCVRDSGVMPELCPGMVGLSVMDEHVVTGRNEFPGQSEPRGCGCPVLVPAPFCRDRAGLLHSTKPRVFFKLTLITPAKATCSLRNIPAQRTPRKGRPTPMG